MHLFLSGLLICVMPVLHLEKQLPSMTHTLRTSYNIPDNKTLLLSRGDEVWKSAEKLVNSVEAHECVQKAKKVNYCWIPVLRQKI